MFNLLRGVLGLGHFTDTLCDDSMFSHLVWLTSLTSTAELPCCFKRNAAWTFLSALTKCISVPCSHVVEQEEQEWCCVYYRLPTIRKTLCIYSHSIVKTMETNGCLETHLQVLHATAQQVVCSLIILIACFVLSDWICTLPIKWTTVGSGNAR